MELQVKVAELLRQVRILHGAIVAINESHGVFQFLLVLLGVANYMVAQVSAQPRVRAQVHAIGTLWQGDGCTPPCWRVL